MNTFLVGQKLQQIYDMSPDLARQFESWVVNTTKVKLLEKYAQHLSQEGKDNLRQLLLEPMFEIDELKKHVEEKAPELKTLFYRELTDALSHLEKRL